LDRLSVRQWGVFMPLHALWSSNSWGIGDYSNLHDLALKVGDLGGDLVGTLPLYASFLDSPFDPSPYAPCSRLFWNEVFIDVEAIPEWTTCADARRLATSPDVRRMRKQLLRTRQVDYHAIMEQKRTVLELLCRHLIDGTRARNRAFKLAMASDPGLVDYGRFRAVMERERTVWQDWPLRQRSGTIEPTDYEEHQALYHSYVQWIARAQLGTLTRAGRRGARLYLDLPLGVHPSGYDVYRHRDLFLQNTSAGAPPDTFFSQGQDWGFPPLNPRGLRAAEYRYFIQVLRNTFRYAGALRVDHIMGFHRLFVVPRGAQAKDGVYIRYPALELYAILLLEAHRSGCRLLVGEDLGTVPDEVRREMERRGLCRMFVWQYELEPQSEGSLKTVPAERVASVNTHDMPTFVGFGSGRDIDERMQLGLLTQDDVDREKGRRGELVTRVANTLRHGRWLKGRTTPRSLLTASLTYLAASAARVVMVNLEDLWLEAEPQNTPGTYRDRPNWTRRARYSLEQAFRQTAVHKTLETIHSMRKQRPPAHE
jgi:4-alpha-glucanotransferase